MPTLSAEERSWLETQKAGTVTVIITYRYTPEGKLVWDVAKSEPGGGPVHVGTYGEPREYFSMDLNVSNEQPTHCDALPLYTHDRKYPLDAVSVSLLDSSGDANLFVAVNIERPDQFADMAGLNLPSTDTEQTDGFGHINTEHATALVNVQKVAWSDGRLVEITLQILLIPDMWPFGPKPYNPMDDWVDPRGDDWPDLLDDVEEGISDGDSEDPFDGMTRTEWDKLCDEQDEYLRSRVDEETDDIPLSRRERETEWYEQRFDPIARRELPL